MHPQYNRRGYKNDIALIKLNKTIDFVKYPNISVVDMAVDVDKPVSDTCFMLGWGKNETGNVTEVLQVAKYPLLSEEECKSNSKHFNATESICGGPKPTAEVPGYPSTCKGDSGGPLMCLA